MHEPLNEHHLRTDSAAKYLRVAGRHPVRVALCRLACGHRLEVEWPAEEELQGIARAKTPKVESKTLRVARKCAYTLANAPGRQSILRSAGEEQCKVQRSQRPYCCHNASSQRDFQQSEIVSQMCGM